MTVSEDELLIAALDEEETQYRMTLKDECLSEEETNSALEHQSLRESNYGNLIHLTKDAEFLYWTTNYPFVICHFYHPDYTRCQILENHLVKLASKYTEIKWIRLNVLNAPFAVAKLHLKVLPCLDVFVDGMRIDRLLGFDDLGNTDTFNTVQLERRLAKSKIFKKCRNASSGSSDSDSDRD